MGFGKKNGKLLGQELGRINAGMKSLAQRCPDCGTWIKAGPSVTSPPGQAGADVRQQQSAEVSE